MGLADGPAPCKCMHGQPGTQGPPGPKVAVNNCESLDKQHTMITTDFMFLWPAGSQRPSGWTWGPRKTRKLGKYSYKSAVPHAVIEPLCGLAYYIHWPVSKVNINAATLAELTFLQPSFIILNIHINPTGTVKTESHNSTATQLPDLFEIKRTPVRYEAWHEVNYWARVGGAIVGGAGVGLLDDLAWGT